MRCWYRHWVKECLHPRSWMRAPSFEERLKEEKDFRGCFCQGGPAPPEVAVSISLYTASVSNPLSTLPHALLSQPSAWPPVQSFPSHVRPYSADRSSRLCLAHCCQRASWISLSRRPNLLGHRMVASHSRSYMLHRGWAPRRQGCSQRCCHRFWPLAVRIVTSLMLAGMLPQMRGLPLESL